MEEKMDCSFAQRIGSCLYFVHVKPTETAKETLDEKMRKMLTEAVYSPSFDAEKAG